MPQRAWLATRKGLIELQRSGDDWALARTSFIGDPVTMVLPPDDGGGRMLAALNLGHFGVKVHASDDAGQSWVEVATPAYPPQPEGATTSVNMMGAPGPEWKLKQIWALEATRGTVWAGTLPGGLFRSDDSGASWQLVESLWNRPERAEWLGGGNDVPGIHSICPHPQQPGDLLLAVSCGGVWQTHDDGANWELTADGLRADFMPPERAGDGRIQDVHRVQRCSARPEVLWCQHHCGIWRSTNGGKTWQELSAAPQSNFGFAVAAHSSDPKTAWFVPAKADQCRVPVDGALSVSRTRDGGQSFERLQVGLPQQDCFELIYRHGLAVADDNRTLLMGSTTGSLWTSFDSGDRWRLVSAHLPPIYALRFG